jgi:hypothetical protein
MPPVARALLLVTTTMMPGGGLALAAAMALANKEVSVASLLQTHAADIASLKRRTAERTSVDIIPFNNDVFYLRHCLDHADDRSKQHNQLDIALDWRLGPGNLICAAALAGVAAATATNKWNNDAVVAAAPHQTAVTRYISPQNAVTVGTRQGDLVYCIRAGQIDDVGLMSAVTVSQMIDFFMFAKEVNFLVVNERSLATDRLLAVLTANDLAGVKLVGGSADFRQALSASSKLAATVYPGSTTGPTLLLNLPVLLSALVKLFTPLFPDSVKRRLKFEQGPLKNVVQLADLAKPDSPQRAEFLRQLDEIVYS